jgi:hypothetical protein
MMYLQLITEPILSFYKRSYNNSSVGLFAAVVAASEDKI